MVLETACACCSTFIGFVVCLNLCSIVSLRSLGGTARSVIRSVYLSDVCIKAEAYCICGVCKC